MSRWFGALLALVVVLLMAQGCSGLTFLAGMPQSKGELIFFIVVIVIALLIIVPAAIAKEKEKQKREAEDEEIRQDTLREIRKKSKK